MAPEYAYRGHFSSKSDVYSFGVLILEIVSGQKICFYAGEEQEHLVAYVSKVVDKLHVLLLGLARKGNYFLGYLYTINILIYKFLQVWRLWNEGTVVEIVDPILGTNFRNEIIRCLHIGLLCVQESVAKRPTMTSIVSMLNSYYLPLPSPSRPGFLLQSTTQNLVEHSSQMRIPTQFSVNEVSITELYPR